jgi:WD40 repeat protein
MYQVVLIFYNDNTDHYSHFLSGSYDGIVRVFNHSNELVQQLVGHEGPVTAVHTIQTNSKSFICVLISYLFIMII